MRVYIKNSSKGIWEKVKDSDEDGIEGALYDENWATNSSIMANVREEQEGVSINMSDTVNYVYHYWPGNGRISVKPENVEGVVVTVEARLMIDNESLNDDRNNARFIVNTGADWWLNKDAPYTKAWGNNAEIGFGRFKYVKPEWQSFTMVAIWPAGHRVTKKDDTIVKKIELPD